MDTQQVASKMAIVLAVPDFGETRRNLGIQRLAEGFGSVLGFYAFSPSLGSFYQPDHTLVFVDRSYSDVGFQEVFWADIVAGAGGLFQGNRAWARGVVQRARGLYKHWPRTGSRSEFIEPDFKLAARVVEEAIETVDRLRSLQEAAEKVGLIFLSEKAGLFSFRLPK